MRDWQAKVAKGLNRWILQQGTFHGFVYFLCGSFKLIYLQPKLCSPLSLEFQQFLNFLITETNIELAL